MSQTIKYDIYSSMDQDSPNFFSLPLRISCQACSYNFFLFFILHGLRKLTPANSKPAYGAILVVAETLIQSQVQMTPG